MESDFRVFMLRVLETQVEVSEDKKWRWEHEPDYKRECFFRYFGSFWFSLSVSSLGWKMFESFLFH